MSVTNTYTNQMSLNSRGSGTIHLLTPCSDQLNGTKLLYFRRITHICNDTTIIKGRLKSPSYWSENSYSPIITIISEINLQENLKCT